jgi:hypothetical protein
VPQGRFLENSQQREPLLLAAKKIRKTVEGT